MEKMENGGFSGGEGEGKHVRELLGEEPKEESALVTVMCERKKKKYSSLTE